MVYSYKVSERIIQIDSSFTLETLGGQFVNVNPYLILNINAVELSANLNAKLRTSLMSAFEQSLSQVCFSRYELLNISAFRTLPLFSTVPYETMYWQSRDPGCIYAANPLDGTNVYHLSFMILELIQ